MLRRERDKVSITLERSIITGVLILVVFSITLTSCIATSPTELTVVTSQQLSPSEYQEKFGGLSDHLLIDVRTPEEFASGYIEGSVNISVESLPNRLNEVPNDLPIVVYCRSGRRSAIAAELLVNAGYQPVYDLGGIQTWTAQGYPIEH